MSTLTREIIFEHTGLKVKFTSEEQLYALQALLKTYLPKRSKTATATAAATEAAVPVETEVETTEVATEVATKPKKVKKAKTVTATAAELLTPADADVTGGDAPALGATDEFRDNVYRLKTLDPALCCGRKIDAANPIVGTRPGDAGAKGKVFPEIQCSKKPVAGGRLCTVCARNESEFLANPAERPRSWYGRLDEPMYANAYVVGCEWFYSKYPEGIEGARPSADTAAPPKKSKKAAAALTDETPAADPPKKSKKAAAAATAVAEEAKTVAKKPKKTAKVADTSGMTREVEWIAFVSDGQLLIRHTKTGNVYQGDRSKHRLEDMVLRDKFEGKWRGGRLDPYAEEDEE